MSDRSKQQLPQEEFDPYYTWLGIPPAEQPPHFYRLLGIRIFEPVPSVIENVAERQLTHLRMLQSGPRGQFAAALLDEVAKARAVLLDPSKKAAYDAQLSVAINAKNTAPSPTVPARQASAIANASAGTDRSAAIPVPAVPHRPSPGVQQKSVTMIIAGAACVLFVASLLLYFSGTDGMSTRKEGEPKNQSQTETASDAPSNKPEAATSPTLAQPGLPKPDVAVRVSAEDSRPAAPPPQTKNAAPKEPITAALTTPPEKVSNPERSPASIGKSVQNATVDASRVNSLGMKLVLIPAGQFVMGLKDVDREKNPSALPRHPVKISRAFYLSATEVTQKEYRAVAGTEPWNARPNYRDGEQIAATYVTWDEANAFCRALSETEKKKYRLPTEAEWEYACRAGSTTRFHFGDEDMQLGEFAWFRDNSLSDTGMPYVHQVGEKRPNHFGVFDTHGNVWEWCQDLYDADIYQTRPQANANSADEGRDAAVTADPVVTSGGPERALRGGSVHDAPVASLAGRRGKLAPTNRNFNVGFRVVCEVE